MSASVTRPADLNTCLHCLYAGTSNNHAGTVFTRSVSFVLSRISIRAARVQVRRSVRDGGK